MKKINLLTDEYKNKIEIKKFKTIITVAITVIFLFSMLFVVIIKRTISILEQTNYSLEVKISDTKYNDSSDVFEKYEELTKLNTDLTSANSRTDKYITDIDAAVLYIINSADEKIKFIALELENTKLTLKFISENEKNINQFLERLYKYNFKEVKLVDFENISNNIFFEIEFYF